MSSAPIRHPLANHLLAAQNSALVLAAGAIPTQGDVWMGMPHGFVTIEPLKAAAQSLDGLGLFLPEKLRA